MQATVTILYRNGSPVPQAKRLSVIEGGSIVLSCRLHPILLRNVAEMLCVDERGACLAEPLFDAACTSISADGLRFRGWEAGPRGREQMQEWFVRPAAKAGEGSVAGKALRHPKPNLAALDSHLVKLGVLGADGSLTDLGRQVAERILHEGTLC